MIEWFNILMARLRALFRRESVLRDIEEELRVHVEMETETNIERGMSPDEARAAALKSFGDLSRKTELGYDIRGGGWVETLWQDLRYGARMLFKRPGFTLIAVITLALGIGANTAIFTWIKAIILQPLPGVAESRRLVTLHSMLTRSGNLASSVSYPDYKDYRDRNEVFSGLAAFHPDTYNLLDGEGKPERVWGSLVSGNYFDVLGVKPALGRAFAPDEDRTPGTHPVVVISHRLWQRRFAADPALIGKTIRLNKRDFTVIGVAPAGFNGSWVGLAVDLWAPLMVAPQISQMGDPLNMRGSHWLLVIGRLKDGVTFEQAEANAQNIAAQLAKDYPKEDEGVGAALFTLVNEPYGAGQMAPWFVVLMVAAGLVLLIACANVANLSLTATAGRNREMGIRVAFGASRGHLFRQMLTESLLLAVMGGAGSALLAAWLSDAMNSMMPPMGFPFSFNLAWDYRVHGFALALTLLTVVAVGLLPALRAAKVDPLVSIRNETGAASLLAPRSRLRSALVVIQIAISLVSLLCGGLFVRSLVEQRKINSGFDPERALLLSMDLFPNGYDEKRGVEFYRRLVERVAALPGVESASLSSNVPPNLFPESLAVFEIEGYTPRADEMINIEYEVVAPRYFQTMRIPLLEGRDFSDADNAQSAPVAIVNETMARRYWGWQSLVGKRLRATSGKWHTVVGVARDIKQFEPMEPTHPWVYYSHAQGYESMMTLIARTTGDPWQSLASVRGVVRDLDPTLPVFDEMTLARHSDAPLFLDRIVVTFLSAFGLLALALAAIGHYGVLAYSVTARTREIGIRMALGAQTRDVLKQVIKQGMVLTLIGVAIGLAAAFALTRLMASLLYGVSPTDALTFTLVSLSLTAIALLACYLPARRATKVNPLVALRSE
ncbi:MAG TPA: ABC transporter permease [Blastocatellia bacterium]|jgi:predicted permease|nr:ABC transporter permease [Blastocatellia bacterium]